MNLFFNDHIFVMDIFLFQMDTWIEPPSRDLLRELECPVCMEYMKSPVYMCEGRHNICSNCRRVLNKCPRCRLHFISARNIYLENLPKQLQHSCKNRHLGCRVKTFYDRIAKHQDECPFGSQKCPFAKVANQNCDWEGSVLEVKKHIKSEHRKLVLKLNGKHMIICTNYTYCRAIFTLGEVFMYYSKAMDGLLYICVLYVGCKERARKFRYRVEMGTNDRKESASMCLYTASYVDEVCDVFKNGQCVVLHYNFVMNCAKVFRGLPVEVEIFPADSLGK